MRCAKWKRKIDDDELATKSLTAVLRRLTHCVVSMIRHDDSIASFPMNAVENRADSTGCIADQSDARWIGCEIFTHPCANIPKQSVHAASKHLNRSRFDLLAPMLCRGCHRLGNRPKRSVI